MGYNRKYYHRHFTQYRNWENAIGKNIVETLNLSSILDLGCGVGSYLEGALLSGCKDILGIELSFDIAKEFFVDNIKNYLIKGDITKNLNLNRTFDCVLSFEVGEHINPEGTEGFINNLTSFAQKYIILTAAPPGQRGTGHINLKPQSFWINKIETKSFNYSKELIEQFIEKWKNFGTEKYILKNLMVFSREKKSGN